MSHNEQYMRKNIHQSVDWPTAVLATTQPHSVIKSNCYIIIYSRPPDRSNKFLTMLTCEN